MNDFELFELVLMSTIAVSQAQYLKEQLEVLLFLFSMDRLSFLINNKDEQLCSHKNVQ